jgi:hypothetical protein
MNAQMHNRCQVLVHEASLEKACSSRSHKTLLGFDVTSSAAKFQISALPNIFPKNFEKNDQLWWFSLATPTGWGRIQPRRSHEVLGRSKQSVLKLIGGSRCKRFARPTGEGEFWCQTSRLSVEPTVLKQSSLRSLQRIAFWMLAATPLQQGLQEPSR